MLEAPSRNKVKNFHKISILVAPPGVKSVAVCDDNAEEFYLSNGWTKQLAGTCPERSYAICGSLKAQRRQHGLRHCAASTLHASMEDALSLIATEASYGNEHYKLWDKAQAIVLLSRTRQGKDLIFVGDKRLNIKALSSTIQAATQ